MQSAFNRRRRHPIIGLAVAIVAALASVSYQPLTAAADQDAGMNGVLRGIAQDSWKFYAADVDPTTHLPLNNLGPDGTRGQYTSPSDIGMYLMAVVAAHDLRLISRSTADSMIQSTLSELGSMSSFNGFLFEWYDTTTGHAIKQPGGADCSTEPTPTQDTCYFLSAVDNGWYATGLIEVRAALPELAAQANALIQPMNFGLFYDSGTQTSCNVNASNQPTGQMFGGYYAYQGPAQYHNGVLYSDPRIAIYIGMGLHQMPGDVWWRSWRTLPPKQCPSDPDFSWQGQWPVGGSWQSYTDVQSGKSFNVWEGHYTYPGTALTFVPTWAGGMFEGLAPNLVMPETTFGPNSFGLNDLRWAQVQMKYTTEVLKYPVWGISPSSTADDTGNYQAYGVTGLQYGYASKQGLSQCFDCAGTTDIESTVTPHASFLALSVLPQAAYTNIVNLRNLYPGLYSSDGGFYDAVNPVTGSIGHRRLVFDQSMIMAALDNALNNGAMQRHFLSDPVSWTGLAYLAQETMSLN